jgi:hypothetical protein
VHPTVQQASAVKELTLVARERQTGHEEGSVLENLWLFQEHHAIEEAQQCRPDGGQKVFDTGTL